MKPIVALVRRRYKVFCFHSVVREQTGYGVAKYTRWLLAGDPRKGVLFQEAVFTGAICAWHLKFKKPVHDETD